MCVYVCVCFVISINKRDASSSYLLPFPSHCLNVVTCFAMANDDDDVGGRKRRNQKLSIILNIRHSSRRK